MHAGARLRRCLTELCTCRGVRSHTPGVITPLLPSCLQACLRYACLSAAQAAAPNLHAGPRATLSTLLPTPAACAPSASGGWPGQRQARWAQSYAARRARRCARQVAAQPGGAGRGEAGRLA